MLTVSNLMPLLAQGQKDCCCTEGLLCAAELAATTASVAVAVLVSIFLAPLTMLCARQTLPGTPGTKRAVSITLPERMQL